MQTPFWSSTPEQLITELKTSKQGLTSAQAQALLLMEHARKKKKSKWRRNIEMFLGQFRSPLMLMLIGAVILSAFV